MIIMSKQQPTHGNQQRVLKLICDLKKIQKTGVIYQTGNRTQAFFARARPQQSGQGFILGFFHQELKIMFELTFS